MTLYLWYSRTQEENALKQQERPSFCGSFNAPPNVGNCIYLDDMGEPVKVTQVSHTPDHNTAFADIRLVGTAEKDNLVSCHRGILTEEGKKFCEKKGIAPNHMTVMRYIWQHEQTMTYLRRDVAVKKPLTLTRGGTPG
ncbi:MAG: hypothetical protein ACAH83_16000 [Alphaproteobacteria bacterium]